MARRFFVSDKDITINEENISVVGTEVHHINVLRHKLGDNILINNYIVEIKELSNDKLIGIIKSIEGNEKKSNVTIRLYQSYLKSDKMEFVVQKAVELGAKNIVPFLSKNCVVKLNDKDKQKKLERLNKISLEASKQCGRSDIVKVEDILEIKDENIFISSLNQNDINILAYEKSCNNIKQVLDNIKSKYDNQNLSIAVIIGPEGGFDVSDMKTLEKVKNMYQISLGERILRAETASINILSIINYVFDV